MEYTGRLYPNGEFGISVARRFKVEAPLKRKPLSEVQRWRLAAVRTHGIVAALEYSGDGSGATEVDSSTLGSSMLPNSHRSTRGSSGITAYGRRCVRNAAFLMERDYGKSNLSFWTLTLPALAAGEWRAVAANWSEVVRYLLTYLRRLLSGANLPDHVVYVTEIQPARSRRDGVPALHLHGLFIGRLPGTKAWKITPRMLRKVWQRSLNAVCKLSLNESQMTASENLQQVKKSAAAYLSKYLSKGMDSGLLQSASSSIPLVVSSWWGLSMSMRRWLKKEILKISHTRSMLFVKVIESTSDQYSRVKEILIDWKDGRKLGVGFYGCLRGQDLERGREAARGRFQATFADLW